MKWRGIKVAAVGFGVVVLVVVLFLASQPADPVYKGRRLSQYLNTGVPAPWIVFYPPFSPVAIDDKTKEAIEAVGTNAFPLLVRMLQTRYYDTSFDIWLRGMAKKHPFLRKFARRGRMDAFGQRSVAVTCFQVLGIRARPAFPYLRPLLDDPDSVYWTVVALGHIGLEGRQEILSLTNVFNIHQPAPVVPGLELLYRTTVSILAKSGTNAVGATPSLLACLASPDQSLATEAAIALAKVGADPESAVPAILESLQDSASRMADPAQHGQPASVPASFTGQSGSGYFLGQRTRAVGMFGHHAFKAMPTLSILAKHSDERVRRGATNAMEAIWGDMALPGLNLDPTR